MNLSTHPTARMPKELRPHLANYFPDSWRGYSLQELGSFVHLLTMRSLQRGNPMKRAKDLYDARNYWRMIGAHLTAHELDAESQTFSFGMRDAPAEAEVSVETLQDEIKEALEAMQAESSDIVANPSDEFERHVPAGDMEQQEEPAGDVDLMGETDGPMDERTAAAVDQVREELSPKTTKGKGRKRNARKSK